MKEIVRAYRFDGKRYRLVRSGLGAPKYVAVRSKHSKPADEIQGNAAAQLPETDLKQVLWQTGSGRERGKCLI